MHSSPNGQITSAKELDRLAVRMFKKLHHRSVGIQALNSVHSPVLLLYMLGMGGDVALTIIIPASSILCTFRWPYLLVLFTAFVAALPMVVCCSSVCLISTGRLLRRRR